MMCYIVSDCKCVILEAAVWPLKAAPNAETISFILSLFTLIVVVFSRKFDICAKQLFWLTQINQQQLKPFNQAFK